MPEQQLRTLVCCGPGPIRDAASLLVGAASAFKLVGHAAHVDEVTEQARTTHPDVLVLDHALMGGDAQRIVFALALERPLPTLLLVDDDDAAAQSNELERKLRLFRLSKRRLCSTDALDQSFARTRLHLVASRCRESKRTVPPHVLQPILESLRQHETTRADTGMRGLVASPLDLAIIALDATHVTAVQEAIASVASLIVPTLVVSEDQQVPALLAEAAAQRQLPVSWLTDPMMLRRATGLLLVNAARRVVVRPEGIWVAADGPRGLSLPEVITSASTLEGAVLLVAASHREGIVRTVADAASVGSSACLLEPPEGTAVSDTLLPMSRQSLAWILRSGMVPRRV
ncbi:MAG: hypothetical protein AAF721_01880 [Myxococcota bacterium]